MQHFKRSTLAALALLLAATEAQAQTYPTHYQLLGLGEGETCFLEPGTLQVMGHRGNYAHVIYRRSSKHNSTISAGRRGSGPCPSPYDTWIPNEKVRDRTHHDARK